MEDFSRRSTREEIMDDLRCSGKVVDQTLRELEFINKWLGGNQVTISALDSLLPKEKRSGGEISIADLGCGGGDMLRHIRLWANARGIRVRLTGIDANPHIIAFAQANISDLGEVKLISEDIFSEAFRTMKFDIVAGTLFFHHFSHSQLVTFFTALRGQVSKGIIINDIHRHPLAYYSIKLLTAIFSRSPMVRYDAPLSVLRAFTHDELALILQEAGYENFSIRWKWAFRWQVIIKLSQG